MKYRLIVTDLDGTLLDGEKAIPGTTKELIKRYRELGGIFTIATGRMEESARRYRDELSIEVPVILYNGAKVVDLNKGTVYFETRLNYDMTKIALNRLKKYPWDVLVYKDKSIYISEHTQGIHEYSLKDGVKCIEVGDLHSYIDSSPTKILVIGSPEKFEEFVRLSSEEFGGTINSVRSEEFYLEILPDNVSKGTALQELCKVLDIELSETIAIGDQLNDLDMIKKAGFGVAVNNANKELKKSADYVTKGNDTCGVAEVIEMVLKNSI